MTAVSVLGPVLVDGAAPVARGRHLPRSRDAAVDQLCRQMREVCAAAVDPLEIAAALEAEAGLTGPMLRARFGCADVFTLADEMYRRTVRWPAEPPPSCPRSPGRHLMTPRWPGGSAGTRPAGRRGMSTP